MHGDFSNDMNMLGNNWRDFIKTRLAKNYTKIRLYLIKKCDKIIPFKFTINLINPLKFITFHIYS